MTKSPVSPSGQLMIEESRPKVNREWFFLPVSKPIVRPTSFLELPSGIRSRFTPPGPVPVIQGANGFFASELADGVRCEAEQLSVLVQAEEITDAIAVYLAFKDEHQFIELGAAFNSYLFDYARKLVRAEADLDPETRFNFVASTDVIGGNSGSPMIDAAGRLIGLVFDGNIHSIGGNYWFDTEQNRTVSVHPAVMIEALTKIYRADRLLDELTAQ